MLSVEQTYEEILEEIYTDFEDLWLQSPDHKTVMGGKIVTEQNCKSILQKAGFNLDTPTHAHGIGNNNEYRVTKRINIGNGFETEAIIGYFHYNYDIYANGVYIKFFDKDKNLIYESPKRTFYKNPSW